MTKRKTVEPLEDDDEEEIGGLTIQQRQFIALLAGGMSPAQACTSMNINIRSYFRWQNQPKFQEGVDKLFSAEDIANLKKALGVSAQETVHVLEDAMANANRNVTVAATCPECGHAFDAKGRVEDWKSRLTAAGMLLKITGILLDRKETKVDVNVSYKLTFAENMMLLRYNRGEAIPPALEQRLRDLGKISGERQLAITDGSAYTEGTYTEVYDESDSGQQQ